MGMGIRIKKSTCVVDGQVAAVLLSQRKALEKGIKDAVSASKKARKVTFKPPWTTRVNDEHRASRSKCRDQGNKSFAMHQSNHQSPYDLSNPKLHTSMMSTARVDQNAEIKAMNPWLYTKKPGQRVCKPG
jgi:hypothetical protein